MGRLVSALVPCYNGADSLARALASIEAQTLAPDEIIVIDDGSTDSSADIARRFSSVKLIQQENRGIGAVRQRLIDEASGEWLAFLDHDDAWAPEKLERQLGLAESTGAVLVHTDVFVNTADGGERQSRWIPPEGCCVLDHLLPNNWLSTPAVLVRRDVLRKVGFPPDVKKAEDWLAWFRVAAHGDFARVPELLTIEFERYNSASAQTLAWYEAERRVLEEFVIPNFENWYDRLPQAVVAKFKQLALRKVGLIASLEAECLDKAKRRPEARKRHIEALRAAPTKGALLRFAKHLVSR